MFLAGCEAAAPPVAAGPIWPNVLVALLLQPEFGWPRFTLLKAFRKSVRNCRYVASVKWKFFISPISASKYPGPFTGPCAGQFPKLPAAGCEKPEALNH